MKMYLSALLQLIRFEYYFARGDFPELYRHVREFPCCPAAHLPRQVNQICRAMDLVLTWYPRRVRCLHRSAATTCLLREWGVPAQMVLGAQNLPFKAHAWVEVAGQVVNDNVHVKETYLVLDCC